MNANFSLAAQPETAALMREQTVNIGKIEQKRYFQENEATAKDKCQVR